MRNTGLACALLIFAAVAATGQECPKPSETGPSVGSEVRTLEGRLVYHNGIRQWFELKLDQPQCGQSTTELVPGNFPGLDTLRGCRVRSTGNIDFSPTGYYSLDTFQFVQKVEPVGTCELQVPFPDYSKARPDKAIRAYLVNMHINYETGDHPVAFRVTSSGKERRPWQAYASYLLTGGYVLYGHCGEGFVVERVFGSRQASPQHFDDPRTPNDMATFFPPEGAAAAGISGLHLGYTCVRSR